MNERVSPFFEVDLKNGEYQEYQSCREWNYLGTVGGKGGISEDRLRY